MDIKQVLKKAKLMWYKPKYNNWQNIMTQNIKYSFSHKGKLLIQFELSEKILDKFIIWKSMLQNKTLKRICYSQFNEKKIFRKELNILKSGRYIIAKGK